MLRNAVVIAFLLLGFGILALSTRRHGAEREPQTVLGQPNGFQGSSAVPKEEVDELFARAKERIGSINRGGNAWRKAAFAFDWLAFLLATTLAAYYGRLPDEGTTQQEQLDFVRRRNRRQSNVVGVCAALMAVSTAVGNRWSMESSSSYHRADEIAATAQHTRSILDGNTLSPDQARATVDDLDKELQR